MNPLRKLIEPRLPSAALGLSEAGAGVVALERRRDAFSVRRAGYTQLPEGLLNPRFDEVNITNPVELTETLAELVTSVGLLKQRRWSVALPENSTRTTILTLESVPSGRGELEEMLRWKTERVIGARLEELRVSRRRLASDAQGQPRYLLSAVRLDVLAEYESIFASLGWHAGLILPRHMGEAWWLMRDASYPSDALLVSTFSEGFTAVLLRRRQPLLVRNVICDEEDRNDELFRFLLFYRDRLAAPGIEGGAPSETIERLLVMGTDTDASATSALVEETLSVAPHTLRAEDVRLALPSSELDFSLLAAPAGLAALKWA
ncbi:MAG TPA: hypothetical protein VGB73_19080 [Pyrinomonadaceae bacterium]|jgi:hypothetical protein